MRTLYTLDFHALRMRAVELAATLTLREPNCSRKGARAAAGRASRALRTAAPNQRELWSRIVSSLIDLNRPRSTWMGEDLRRSLRITRRSNYRTTIEPVATCSISLVLGPRARHDGSGDDPRPRRLRHPRQRRHPFLVGEGRSSRQLG